MTGKSKPKYTLLTTKKFDKDYKRIEKRGYNLDLLEAVVDKLLADDPLPQENKDHSLKGSWQDYRECHISSDWLLVYLKDDTMLVLTATRTGTHSDIFDK